MDHLEIKDRWGMPNNGEEEDDYQRAEAFGKDKREVQSEFDYQETEVKRKNFVDLFLHNYEADKYIMTHLYGGLTNLNPDADFEEVDNFFETSAVNLSTTFAKRARVVEKSSQNIRKMSPGETYIALIKGFCATAVLLLPITY
jgi:hypothetical protein